MDIPPVQCSTLLLIPTLVPTRSIFTLHAIFTTQLPTNLPFSPVFALSAISPCGMIWKLMVMVIGWSHQSWMELWKLEWTVRIWRTCQSQPAQEPLSYTAPALVKRSEAVSSIHHIRLIITEANSWVLSDHSWYCAQPSWPIHKCSLLQYQSVFIAITKELLLMGAKSMKCWNQSRYKQTWYDWWRPTLV